MFEFLISLMPSTCPAHLILLDLFTLSRMMDRHETLLRYYTLPYVKSAVAVLILVFIVT
jgi:hypothetical protein